MTNHAPWFLMFSTIMLMILIVFLLQNIHPIMMVIMLVLYTMMICFISAFQNKMIIYSIMIFLMMISGLLIMFLYFASISSNIPFYWKSNKFIPTMLIINLIAHYSLVNSKQMNMINWPTYELESLQNISNSIYDNISLIYNYPFNILTIICIMYLLLTLFVIIKICLSKTKSLRKIS